MTTDKGVAVVTGAGSGLGAMIARRLEPRYAVMAYDIRYGHDVLKPQRLPPRVDVLVNCAGVNALDWLENVTEEDWDWVMEVNVKGILKMTQALLPQLRASNGTVLNIVSSAASVPMRCSAAYNASKAAALMLTRQLARELSDSGITVFSISPNKLEGTKMSREVDARVLTVRDWTPRQAAEYQRASLLAGEETDPETLAEFIGFLLSTKQRHKFLAGCDIPYGA